MWESSSIPALQTCLLGLPQFYNSLSTKIRAEAGRGKQLEGAERQEKEQGNCRHTDLNKSYPMVNLQCQLDLIWNHHRNADPNVNSVFLERFIGEREIYVGCGLCRCTGWGQERSLSTGVHLPATRLLLTLLPLQSVPLTCAPQ